MLSGMADEYVQSPLHIAIGAIIRFVLAAKENALVGSDLDIG